MKNTHLTAAAALLLLAAACTPTLAPLSFPMSYRFMGNAGEVSVAPTCARFAGVDTVDGRSDKSVAGQRYLEQGGPRYDITADGDVAGWLRLGADKALSLASIEVDPDAAYSLRLTLQSLDLQESAYRQSEFDGRVVVEAALVKDGENAWSVREDGFAENYGRPGNPENYQETVNHALDRALAKVVNNPELRDAACE